MMNNEVRLNCGINMPVLGLGTYSYPNDRQTTELAIDMALKVHFARARTHILSLYAFFPFLQPSICFFWLFLSFHFKCSALRCSPSLIDTGALMIALNKAWLNPLD
jgi:hypothetical protein